MKKIIFVLLIAIAAMSMSSCIVLRDIASSDYTYSESTEKSKPNRPGTSETRKSKPNRPGSSTPSNKTNKSRPNRP